MPRAALGGPQGAFTYSAAPGGLGFPTTFAPISFPPGAILPARSITILAGQCSYLNQFLPVDQLHFCDNNFQNPYTQQWNLGFEHDLGGGWLFAMDYIGSHTIHIEQPVDLNSPSPFIRTAPGPDAVRRSRKCYASDRSGARRLSAGAAIRECRLGLV